MTKHSLFWCHSRSADEGDRRRLIRLARVSPGFVGVCFFVATPAIAAGASEKTDLTPIVSVLCYAAVSGAAVRWW